MPADSAPEGRRAAPPLRAPASLSEIDAGWMSAALSRRHPGAVVARAMLGPVTSGTNARARVALEYAAGDGPASVFVKGPGSPLNRAALAVLGALGMEAELAGAGFSPPLEHAALLAGAHDRPRGRAVVVLEDVTARGGRPNDARRALSLAEVESGLAGLAALHAAFFGNPAPLATVRPWRLGRCLAPVSLASLARGLRLAGPLRARRCGPVALERQFRASALLAAAGPRTLLHGDPHPGNTYAIGEATTGFYDWQLLRTGSWSHDVGYFLIASAGIEDRRARERELLAGYLDELGARGVRPPRWEEALARYRAAPAFGLATWVHTLSFASFQPPEVCRATIARFAAAYDDLETDRSLVGGGR